MMIKRSGGLPEKQIRSSKLVTQSINIQINKYEVYITQNVMYTRNRIRYSIKYLRIKKLDWHSTAEPPGQAAALCTALYDVNILDGDTPVV